MIRPLLLLLLLTAATPAQAELTLCNRTSYVMQTALALERRANISTRGWFRIDPGACRKVIEGPLEADLVYVHARAPQIYGTAPLPRSGHADFCVNEQDFAIANARGCSSPVRFTAIKPVESDKGPVANLAEEADYDPVQARLAGIQRLLVIAGYDANPIDGVQGTKTGAALAHFLADRKLAADSAGADFFDILLKAAQSPEGFGFAWCNDTRDPVMAAVGIAESAGIVTRGWYRVESGQCVRPELRGEARQLYSYGEAVDADGQAIKRDGKALAWGGDVMLCTREGKFELNDHKDCTARGLTPAGFAAIDAGVRANAIRFKDR